MPIISAVGKRRPQSTTTIRPSYSTTVMFFPISPTPPSGRTRSLPLTRRGLRVEQAVALEGAADDRELGLVGLDERQPEAADVVARAGSSAVLTGVGLAVQNIASIDVAQRRRRSRARCSGSSNMRRISVPTTWLDDADAAGAAEVERAGEVLVVAGEHRQPVDRAAGRACWTA